MTLATIDAHPPSHLRVGEATQRSVNDTSNDDPIARVAELRARGHRGHSEQISPARHPPADGTSSSGWRPFSCAMSIGSRLIVAATAQKAGSDDDAAAIELLMGLSKGREQLALPLRSEAETGARADVVSAGRDTLQQLVTVTDEVDVSKSPRAIKRNYSVINRGLSAVFGVIGGTHPEAGELEGEAADHLDGEGSEGTSLKGGNSALDSAHAAHAPVHPLATPHVPRSTTWATSVGGGAGSVYGAGGPYDGKGGRVRAAYTASNTPPRSVQGGCGVPMRATPGGG